MVVGQQDSLNLDKQRSGAGGDLQHGMRRERAEQRAAEARVQQLHGGRVEGVQPALEAQPQAHARLPVPPLQLRQVLYSGMQAYLVVPCLHDSAYDTVTVAHEAQILPY